MAFFEVPLSFLLLSLVLQTGKCTDRPVIGVLVQEFSSDNSSSYIAAGYVKAVEGSGARVVPIFLKQPISYYRNLLHKLNGVVLQGGNSPLDSRGGFFETAATIYSIGKEMELAGVTFPILGVCQGFEALALITNNMDSSIVTQCNGMYHAMLPLEFKPGFRNSSLYGDASDEIISTLANMNVTPNYHKWCIRQSAKLSDHWTILSVNKDADGLEFVSSMENGNFVGIQFHPEKCAYEWTMTNPSFKKAIETARHFYDWLVAAARLNDNHFPTPDEEDKHLIYNYNPEYTGKIGYDYEQMYIFG